MFPEINSKVRCSWEDSGLEWFGYSESGVLVAGVNQVEVTLEWTGTLCESRSLERAGYFRGAPFRLFIADDVAGGTNLPDSANIGPPWSPIPFSAGVKGWCLVLLGLFTLILSCG